MKSLFLKRQIIGTILVTSFVILCSIALMLYAHINPSYADTHVTLIEFDGGGRRGMFVLWLLLLFLFTIGNVLFSLFKKIKSIFLRKEYL